MSLKEAEFLYDAATLLGQHYGRWFNGWMDLTVTSASGDVEAVATDYITKLTHHLGLRLGAWTKGASEFHWIYANSRHGQTVTSRLALYLPYEHVAAAEAWLASKQTHWATGEHVKIGLTWKWHDPRPKNKKLKEVSRRKFHWKRMRDLWGTIDPAIDHWSAQGHRGPLLELLGAKVLPINFGDALRQLKAVGASHSLGAKTVREAEEAKMGLLSAFKDAAWDHIDAGWEIDEHRDRVAEFELRREQLARIEILGGSENALGKHRDKLARQRLLDSWPVDPRMRPRTWTGWWTKPGQL